MTAFDYSAKTSGGWNNPENWFNTATGKFNDGVPAKGDEAAPFTGQEDISGGGGDGADVLGFTFESGSFDVGIFDSGTVNGATVAAATIASFGGNGVLVTVAAGKLVAGSVAGGALDVTGGSAVINGRVGSGGGNPSLVTLEGGSADIEGALTGALDVRGKNATATAAGAVEGASAVTADFGRVSLNGPVSLNGGSLDAGFGGEMTVARDAAAQGGTIDANGARLIFENDLSMSGGTILSAESNGRITARNITADGGSVIASPHGSLSVSGDLAIDGGAKLVLHFAGGRVGVGGDLTLGKTGEGDLILAGGSAVQVTGDVLSAVAAGSKSTDTVSDAGAVLTIGGDWQIGIAGTAGWTLGGGIGVSVAGAIELGVNAGGNGTLVAGGLDTVLTGGGDVTIGKDGTGAVTVQSGAVLDAAAGAVAVGEAASGVGTLTVTGAGSEFEAGLLTVGGAGKNATAIVSAGGDLQVGHDLTLAEEQGSKGTLKVSDAGSVLAVGGNATLGAAGSGTLSMTGGKASVAGALTLGEAKSSKGILVLSDAGLAIAGKLTIGEKGSGTVLVQQGADFTAGAIEIGAVLGAKGALTIDGPGTGVTGGGLTIGGGGTGSLKITGGGGLLTKGDAAIGEVAIGAVMSASLDTGASWSVSGNLAVGEGGAGSLSLKGSKTALVVEGNLTIGGHAGGAVTLGSSTAASSAALNWGGTLAVGEGASGMLTIDAGDIVTAVKGGARALEIGAAAGAAGIVVVSGPGAQLSGRTLAVGGTEAAAGGTGSLTIDAMAAASFAAATIWKTGAVADAGTLRIAGATTGNGTLQIDSGGLLDLGGADKTAGVVFTAGAGETLVLAAPKVFAAEIAGFGTGDTIEILGAQVSGKGFAKGVLTLSDGATLKFAGSHALAGFRFAKSGQNTDITYRGATSASADIEAHRMLDGFAAHPAILARH